MLKPDEEQSFFDRERDRLTGEIATVRAFYFHFKYSTCLARATTRVGRFQQTYPHGYLLYFLSIRDSKNYYRAAMS